MHLHEVLWQVIAKIPALLHLRANGVDDELMLGQPLDEHLHP